MAAMTKREQQITELQAELHLAPSSARRRDILRMLSHAKGLARHGR
jgi:hypothetical protein